MVLTILTPTYNRGIFLKHLYKSLCVQSVLNFQWLIIDDGSNDDTKSIVKEFNNSLFKIDYYYKENEGKHTALNFSHPYILGKWVFVVDSDDTLTDDAVEFIVKYIKRYKTNNKIGAISFERIDKEGVVLSKNNFVGEYVSNTIDYRINSNILGDQAEIYRTKIFTTFKFPVFVGEKFLSESFLHINSAYVCDTVYVAKPIYVTEYLDTGLTRSGRRMRIRNPLGGMIHGSLFFDSRFKWKYRVKGMILYICYGLFADKSFREIIRRDYVWLCLCSILPSVFLYFYWYIKYVKLRNWSGNI